MTHEEIYPSYPDRAMRTLTRWTGEGLDQAFADFNPLRPSSFEAASREVDLCMAKGGASSLNKGENT